MNRVKKKLKEYLRKMSIQKKFAYAFSLVFILLFVVQAQIYSLYITKVVKSNANNYILQTIKQGSGKIDAYIDSLKIVSKNILSNTVILDIISEHSSVFNENPTEISYGEKQIINEELSKLTLAYNYINSIQIYTSEFTINYNFVGEFDDYSDILNIREGTRLKESKGELLLLSSRKEYVDKISGEKAYVFSAVRKIIDYLTGAELGYIFININESAIRQTISDITIVEDGTVLVFDDDGYIVSSMETDEIGEPLNQNYLENIEKLGQEGYFFTTENRTEHIVVFHKSENSRWGTLTSIPVSDAAGDLNDLRLILIAITIAGVFLAIFISWIISRELTQPLKSLVKSMERMGNGDLSVRVKVKTSDEIGHLGIVFNNMADELQELIEQYYHEQLSNKKAQLMAIRAQINPHFLYNTLDTIYWMLVLKNEEKISELIISLSEIMRYSISRDSNQDTVPAATDLGSLEHYISIQKARFGDKLAWKTVIEPDVYVCHIPHMLLQPIVENSINHGMKPTGEQLYIVLSGKIIGEDVVFTVEDNGTGINQERIESILNGTDQDTHKNRSTGFGISGVNRRIKILFGDDYGISLESKLGIGTTVTMRIPKVIHLEDKEHEDISG